MAAGELGDGGGASRGAGPCARGAARAESAPACATTVAGRTVSRTLALPGRASTPSALGTRCRRRAPPMYLSEAIGVQRKKEPTWIPGKPSAPFHGDLPSLCSGPGVESGLSADGGFRRLRREDGEGASGTFGIRSVRAATDSVELRRTFAIRSAESRRTLSARVGTSCFAAGAITASCSAPALPAEVAAVEADAAVSVADCPTASTVDVDVETGTLLRADATGSSAAEVTAAWAASVTSVASVASAGCGSALGAGASAGTAVAAAFAAVSDTSLAGIGAAAGGAVLSPSGASALAEETSMARAKIALAKRAMKAASGRRRSWLLRVGTRITNRPGYPIFVEIHPYF